MKLAPYAARQALYDTLTPIALYDKLRKFFANELVFLLESGVNTENGNFSIVAVGAIERVWRENNETFYERDQKREKIADNPLVFLKELFAQADSAAAKDAARSLGIGFIDGFFGYIAYDAVQLFEPTLQKVMRDLKDIPKTREVDLIRPKYLFTYSHKNHTLTATSAFYESGDLLEEALKVAKSPTEPLPLEIAEKLGEGRFEIAKDDFYEKIARAKNDIFDGEIFQILLANRFVQPARVDPFSFYRILRSKNPSPYQYLLPFESCAFVGCSPEMLVSLRDSQITLRPIAGTRRRGATLDRDLEMERELLEDEKERAEHIMLVDLGRNDVGRVAKAGTVRARNLMHIERYSHVMHIVSDIHAEIAEGKDMFDLFMSAFSAGTMTGAPKVRAMELIAKYEGGKRGFYSGAVVWFGFGGDMDSAIAIRSAQIDADRIIFHAGCGIVADSKSDLEWLEVKNKMAALRDSLDELAGA
ncbi:MAG: anthranilate synthase component I family protein [Helicobacteraceae bacterium]|nr:anthranilate synthase component I family protein [Helicobacteraceae bacterium]